MSGGCTTYSAEETDASDVCKKELISRSLGPHPPAMLAITATNKATLIEARRRTSRIDPTESAKTLRTIVWVPIRRAIINWPIGARLFGLTRWLYRVA